MNRFDTLMYEYYKVLNNAWKKEIKEAARFSIQALADIPQGDRTSEKTINKVIEIINSNLGQDFAAEVNKDTKTFIQKSFEFGLKDVRKQVGSGISIGIYGLEQQGLVNTFTEQSVFWVGEHFNGDISGKFTDALTDAMRRGYTQEMLADRLKIEFQDLGKQSAYYWQGLAEHTALRVREFGRLEGYQRAGATHYRLINPMDERTSEICYALISQNKRYPLADAIQVRDQMMTIDLDNIESAREQLKALAPWVKDSQIIRNEKDEPIAVSGAHTPFPPFHWKCRTETVID